MDFNSLVTSPALETAGVWREYLDARFLVASINSPAFQALQRKRMAAIPPGTAKNPAIIDPILGDCMAEAILLDFEGVTRDGQPFPPTLENKKALCRLRTFRDWLANEATDISNFQEGKKEEEISDLKSGPGVAN